MSRMHFVQTIDAPRAVCGVAKNNRFPLVFGNEDELLHSMALALWQTEGLVRCARCVAIVDRTEAEKHV